jgi:hypothetical protein
MEHLGDRFSNFEPRPHFLGRIYDYDSRGFHHFPTRVNWKVSADHQCEPVGESSLPFQTFLQSWLFFGLLAAVLGEDIGSKEALNTLKKRGTAVTTYINTTKLKGLLEAWEAREVRDREGQTMRMVRIQVALDRARGVVKRYCSVTDHDAGSAPSEPGGVDGILALSPQSNPAVSFKIEDAIALSLMVLGETLTNAKAKIVERVGFRIRGWHGDAAEGWGTSKAVLERMRRDGWCEKTIHMLKGQFRDNATSLLSACLTYQIDDRTKHKNKGCTKKECKVTAFDANSVYEPQHSPDCEDLTAGCQFVGPNVDELIKIVDQGDIPVLTIKPDTLSVKVAACERYGEYATISHVWADGYGNPTSNELRLCQLKFFHSLLRKAQTLFRPGRPESEADEPIPFWIDTLTIPVGAKYKDQRKDSISRIHEIYSSARFTIVIDNGLSTMEGGDEYYESAMKILASGWMR